MKAIQIRIKGVVQGVGFRPFVYKVAHEYNLKGWVLNDSSGVLVHVEGPGEIVNSFSILLEKAAPEAAVISSVEVSKAKEVGYADFRILESTSQEGERTLISPDLATCPACQAEIFDANDRRNRYPFTNCTDCGPRFTIIKDSPYDRPATTMAEFKMCPECQAEYEDQMNRRFHAQPNACFVCGPRLYLNYSSSAQKDALQSPELLNTTLWEWLPAHSKHHIHRDRHEEAARSNSILIEAVDALHEEKILALKGLGGFQLACNARSESAVRKLRERKRRFGKPFAVMFANLEQAERYVYINDQERELLTGRVRPIVLCKKKQVQAGGAGLAESVAFNMPEIGVMLPSTGLHHLLLEEFYGPLIMTSGNISEEPILTDNAQALEKLDGIADLFLLHDRDISSRYDDSVVRIVGGRQQMVRRARGYAPYPIFTPDPETFSEKAPPAILAVGPEQKNTFTLLDGEHAFVSQHIGDLENTETLDAFEETEELYERLFRIHPDAIAYDMHPEYLSTKWAKVQKEVATYPLEIEAVQHHHAHIASTTAEFSRPGYVIGIAFDGTGYGDGSDPKANIWGSEVLISDWAECIRFAHLAPLPLPGGAAAIKRPLRTAIGMLAELDLLGHPALQEFNSRLEDREVGTVQAMIAHELNTPYTTSMGRLFDAVSSLIGVTDEARFEGSPAIELEAVADPIHVRSTPTKYQFALVEQGAPVATLATHEEQIDTLRGEFKPIIIDPKPVIHALLDDMQAGVTQGELSKRFHVAVIRLIGDIATKASLATNLTTVVLSGGVMMNRIIVEGATELLESKGFEVLISEELPVNDGCISFGQAVVARERLLRSSLKEQ